ncbi:MAG: DUF4007 family protein [Sphingomonas sp.]|nr:DUF4007 family protein [Sphingomonas sp.]
MRGGDRRFGTKAQFAGHETFPLRLLWLRKAYDAVGAGAPIRTFQEHDAIARFGVGRNMAVAIRYWALASGLFAEHQGTISATELGHRILSDDGFDPYLEAPATIWLVHWNIASAPERTTTTYFAFNHLVGLEFDSASIVDQLLSLTSGEPRPVSRSTLKRDVEVFLRGYVRRGEAQIEDAAEPLLAELGLVREARVGGWFEFVRGPKPSLPQGVFAYALGQFWEQEGNAATLTAEQICYAPGSPGRVFKLDEDSVVTRLMALGELTGDAWRWVDTAGLRQVQRRSDFDASPLIEADYRRASLAAAA